MKFLLILIVVFVCGAIFDTFRKNRKNKTAKLSPYIPLKNTSYDTSEKIAPTRVEFDLSFKTSDSIKGEYLVFDIETTGLISGDRNNIENYPFIVQICWFLFDEKHKLIEWFDYFVKQDKPIQAEATRIHHITTEKANLEGELLSDVLEEFIKSIGKAKILVAHNIDFDLPIINAEMNRKNIDANILHKFIYCTMKNTISYCKLYNNKFPKLEELAAKCFFGGSHITINESHNAQNDARFTAKCLFYLLDNKIIKIANGVNVYEVKNFYGSGKIEKQYFTKKEENVDTKSIFFGKKVVITGKFESITRNEIGKYLFDCGAKLNSSISKMTDYVIVGKDAGPTKMELVKELMEKGKDIKILSEEEIVKIMNG